MKVIQEQAEFKPVTIKLESQFEVDVLSDLMVWCYHHSSKASFEEKLRNFIREVAENLVDVSSDKSDYVYISNNESEGNIKFK